MATRTFLLCLLVIVFASASRSEAPKSFKYQVVVRDAEYNPLSERSVSFRLSILRAEADGQIAYRETQTETTSPAGLATFNIGQGEADIGRLDTINWGIDDYFLRVEFDPEGGGDYLLMGTSELLAVPYALYSENTGPLGQSSTNYYGSGRVRLAPEDTVYETIPGLEQTIAVPENSTVLLSTTGIVFASGFNCFAMAIIGLFIDGAMPEKGGKRNLWIVTDDNRSSGGAGWTINYPVQLSPGVHTVSVKAKAFSQPNQCRMTIDNEGFFDNSALTVTILRN
jgi:hypothetical protein